MITDLTYNDFCNRYYIDAKRSADFVIAEFIKKNEGIDPSLDLELIKDVAIANSLRKAYDRFDFEHEKKASIGTFLSTIIHNQLMTELRKEGTAIGAGKKKSLEDPKNVRIQQTLASDEDNEATQMRKKVMELLERLDPVKRTIIDCWMENQRTYCSDALHLLGWGPERRGEVKALKAQAVADLQEMSKQAELVEEATEKPKQEEEKTRKSEVYERDIPLKHIKGYVEYIKECIGLFHPSLDAELSLLKSDPERMITLYEFVLPENIKTAFLEGGFTYEEKMLDVHISFLWLVANLYYGPSYQRYQSFLNEQISDDLMWNAVREDLLHFYVFMQDNKEEAPITIKVGKKKVVIEDAYGWFQSLMAKHLFPNCLPDIKSKEQAMEKLKKPSGRKVENELAISIINGLATYFSVNELIKGRAPKNLCTFIRQYLILMDILDVNDSIIREENIKSAINYALSKESDARLHTIELKEASLEDLATAGVIPEARWLFSEET